MTKKRATINVTGMNRDQAKGLMDSKFTFENMNIRITARDESNTSLAVTNEKGTKLLDNEVFGMPVGVFSCDCYFGIFSYKRTGVKFKDHITVYKKDGDEISTFFHWQGSGLGFHEIDVTKHRIETEISVEATNSIRVYWVDGVHQPRVIDFMKLKTVYGSDCDEESIAASYFDFLPVVKDITSVKIEKTQNGYFYSGTIQFVITEVINGNESNIVYYSPLYYASDDANNRGYKPDNTSAGTAFRVNFDCEDYKLISYFNIYAIYRSSQDGAAIVVKREVQSAASSSVIVAGNEEAVDSSYLLFLNRQPMVGAQTITQKDGVMFLANWQADASESDTYVSDVTVQTKSGATEDFRHVETATFTENGASMTSQLKHNSFEIGHFKRGESYMLGYQLMDEHGYWQHPKFIKNGDANLFEMDKSPIMSGNLAFLPHFEAEVSGGSNFIKARPVIAYVDDAQKPCLYQGIVTPTIYSEKERVEGTCFAKLSPFTRSFRVFGSDFKPSMLWVNPPKIITEKDIQELSSDVYENPGATGAVHSYLGFGPTSIDANVKEKTSMKYGTYPAAQHLQALGTTKDYNNEFQSSWRYRDVVFKTALIPKGDENRGSSTLANKIKKVEVEFQIYCKKDTETWNSVWVDYFYLGKGTDDFYYLVYWTDDNTATKKKLDKETYDNLNNFSTGSDAIKAMLWTDSDAIYGDEVENELGEKTGYWKDRTLPFGATIKNISGGGLNAYADCDSKWRKDQFETKLSDSSYSRDLIIPTTLKATFGMYTEDSSSSGNDNTTDVFTCDNAAYFVDASTVTLHSPDITDSTAFSQNNGSINIVGAVRMNGFTSDTSIVAQTAKLNNKMPGSAGFQNFRPSSGTSGRCAMALPNWCSAWQSADMELAPFWSVAPFGVSDYLAQENDSKEISDRVASKLTYHQLANYRFCDKTAYDSETKLDGCAIETAFGKNMSITALGTEKLIYHPAEDGLITPNLAYFWSNGPYYTTVDSLRTRGAKGGIHSINKFTNWRAGQIWQQHSFVGVWLKAKDLQNLLSINMLPMLSIMNSVDWNRGFWHNGGTVDDIALKCGTLTLNQGTMSYADDKFQEVNINDLNGNGIRVCPYSDCGDFGNGGAWDSAEDPVSYTVSVKYRANPHMAIKLSDPLWNYTYLAKYAIGKKAKYCSAGWNTQNTVTSLEDSDIAGWKNDVDLPGQFKGDKTNDFLWLVDIVNNTGTPSVEPSTAQWMIAGEAVDLKKNKATIKWYQGNWYFQRFDCLRTYPETVEEKNQVVEIVSFMCETRRNIDGRYDSHGGQAFLQANPNNYNLINDAYTQKNNFFSYSIPSMNDNVQSTYPTSVTWSLQKTLNSNVDAWTSITGSNLLDMEGDKGPIVHLTRLGNNIFCFQPSGISAIAYNERTPLAAEEGMPVELAMSGKVDGKQYLANAMGAERNTNIVTTDRAVYFVDSYNKTMCMLTEATKLLSEELGFHSWMATLPSPNLMRMHYDRKNNCVMGTNSNTAIVFNELLGQYESFMSYEGTRELINVQDKTLILHTDGSDTWHLWELNGGEYNSFFGQYKDYWIDMLIGGTPTDKVFDNIEFRGDLLEDTDLLTAKKCPFNTIRAYNEYQDSEEKPLKFNQFSISNLKNRFRSWFAYVPRNAERRMGRILERMRNPWCHIVLLMRQPEEEKETGRAQVQELNIDYTE